MVMPIFIDGKWIAAGTFEPVERDIAKGIGGQGLFEYDADYVLSHLDDVSTCRVGLRYPVNFELYKSAGWPAFLLDILPSGAGRRVWVHRLGLKNNETADWQLLLNGAGNPPGKCSKSILGCSWKLRRIEGTRPLRHWRKLPGHSA